MKKRIRNFEILTLLFTLFICIFLFTLKVFINKSETNLVSLKTSIEQEWQENIKSDLSYIQDYLEDGISNGNINIQDDNAITNLVLDHLSLKNKPYIKNFDLINLGYSLNDNIIDLNLSIQNDSLNDEERQYIKEKCSTSLNISKSNNEIEKQIEEISIDVANKFNIDYYTIREILINSIFEKDKILFSTSSNTFNEEDINELRKTNTYNFKNSIGNDIWIESLSVPSGNLGFENEPLYKNEKENLSYKKIVLVATIDSKLLMEPYVTHENDIRNFKLFMFSLLTVVIVVTAIFACAQFVHLLKKYNVGGDTNAEISRCDCSFISIMLRIYNNGVRTIWKKPRKKH